eukprot:4643465-Alexandrium_andersonii.AAC.1
MQSAAACPALLAGSLPCGWYSPARPRWPVALGQIVFLGVGAAGAAMLGGLRGFGGPGGCS